jgi:hypothetical protein
MKQVTKLFSSTIFLLTLLATSYHICAQSVSNIEHLIKKYPDEDAIILLNKEHVIINFENNQWHIDRHIEEKTQLLTTKAQMGYAQESIGYSGFETISDIKAQTLLPNPNPKGKYISTPVTDIQENDVMIDGIFYGDYKEKSFVYPALQPGAITELSYHSTGSEPHLLINPFFISSYKGPTLESEFSVEVPSHITITYRLFGDNTDVIKFNKTNTKNGFKYTWTAKNLAPIPIEDAAPHRSYYAPHILVYINDVVVNNQTIEVLGSEKNLYNWYSNMCKNINQQESPELRAKVAELTQNLTKPTEKAARIYNWVQNNIKYIAFEDGLGGFVPREAGDIYQKKYGDCKDMSNIITNMLRMTGIEAHLAWIGTRDRPYTYSEAPCPIADNHMICVAKIDNQYVFLDGTGEFQPFGLPTAMIQGKEALVGIAPNHYEIIQVPTAPKENNVRKEQLNLQIQDKTLVGKGTCELTGYRKIYIEYDKLKSEAKGQKDYFNNFLRKGNNKCAVKVIDTQHFNQANNTASITYEVSIPNYITTTQDKIYLNPHLIKPFKDATIDLEKRTIAKESDFNYEDSYQFVIELDNEYSLAHLPENKHFNNEHSGFDLTYNYQKNKITINFKVFSNYLLLKTTNFAAWNDFVQQLNDAYQEVIVLKNTP